MKKISYKTTGVCSRSITVVLDEGDIVRDVEFEGGCSGNTQGVAKLVLGRPASEVIDLLAGTPCGTKATSCPDQLSIALKEALAAKPQS